MGGDFGPRVTVPATLEILRSYPFLTVVLLGDSEQIQRYLSCVSDISVDRYRIHHCSEAIAMDEKPSSVLRNKRDSSMWQALKLVADGEADACVSAGNTGALMAMSLLQLRTLPGISRPAICTKVPTAKGYTYLLDLGANVVCSAEQLYQFGMMASEAVSVIDQCSRPSVGLLNIGIEDIKGRQEILEAAELLKSDADINYVGFVEGDDIFKGVADIVVSDGFSGNIALKASEGVAVMLQGFLKQALSDSLLSRVGAWLARPALKKLQSAVDPAYYNGASLLGLKGVVVKSHGGATNKAFARALDVAVNEARRHVPSLIEERLATKNN
jgi:glycerol-3-phosphate acyltransferase PlsX